MMSSGENNHHVHNGYGKEMASSSDVKDTEEDKDKDKSNNSIALSFDEPSAENLIMDVSESECNILDETLSQSDTSNVSKELNYEDDVKTSANVKEARYFNIFECGRNLLDKLDVTYQRAFTASEKTSRKVHITTCNRIKQKKPSPLASGYEYPMMKRYWGVLERILTDRMAGKDKGLINESLKILTERMIGTDKDMILEAVSQLKQVDEEDHERNLERFIHQYDEHGDTFELLDSIESDEFKK